MGACGIVTNQIICSITSIIHKFIIDSRYFTPPMCQTLFYIPTEVFGLPLLGVNGLLFWGFLLWAVIWFAWVVLKRGLNADDLSFVFVILLVAG